MTDLYVIGEGNGSGVVKIGKSGDVKVRLASLQTGYPRKLQALHVEPESGHLEDWLHDRFAAFRLHGEWFDFGANDPVATVRAAIEEQRSTELLEASIRAEFQTEFDAKLAAGLAERDLYWQAHVSEMEEKHEADRGAWLMELQPWIDQACTRDAAIHRAMTILAESGDLVVDLPGPDLGRVVRWSAASVHEQQMSERESREILDKHIAELTRELQQQDAPAPADLPSIEDVLNGVDTGLFQQLVDQAFVPKMPERRIEPA